MNLHYKLWKALLPLVSTAKALTLSVHDDRCDCCRLLKGLVAQAKLADAKCDEILKPKEASASPTAGSTK